MKPASRRSSFVKWAILLALPIAISTQLGGCESSSSGPGGYVLPNRYFKDSVQPIFADRCAGCHSSSGGSGWSQTGADSGGLDLESHAYASLVNQPAYERRFSDAAPRLRVKPGFPDSSYLYHKISKDDSALAFGGRMPYESGVLPDGDIAIIKKWIEYNAPLGDTTTH